MDPPILERAVAILGADPAVAMPLPELARRVGTVDAEGLAARLAGDPRVRILGPPVLPGLSALSPERAADYERALTAAGVRPCRRVALLHRTPTAATGVAALLQDTAAHLLGPAPHDSDAERLVEAAELACRALRAADQSRGADLLPGSLLTAPAAAVPSTTPLPDPPPPGPDPPPTPRHGHRPPRRP